MRGKIDTQSLTKHLFRCQIISKRILYHQHMRTLQICSPARCFTMQTCCLFAVRLLACSSAQSASMQHGCLNGDYSLGQTRTAHFHWSSTAQTVPHICQLLSEMHCNKIQLEAGVWLELKLSSLQALPFDDLC